MFCCNYFFYVYYPNHFRGETISSKKEESPIIFLLLIRDDFIEGINQKFIHR